MSEEEKIGTPPLPPSTRRRIEPPRFRRSVSYIPRERSVSNVSELNLPETSYVVPQPMFRELLPDQSAFVISEFGLPLSRETIREKLEPMIIFKKSDVSKALCNTIIRFNSYFIKCNKKESVSFSDLSVDFGNAKIGVIQKIRFSLLLDLDIHQSISEVICNVYIMKSDPTILNLLYNPKKIGLYMNFGKLDSETKSEYKGKGYNKVLRTIAYYIMHDYFKCDLLGTFATSPITLHVLLEYFGFDVRKSNSSLQKLLQEAKIEDYKYEAANEEILSGLSTRVESKDINMLTDLTNPGKIKYLEFMVNQIINCDCPPCKNKPLLLKR